jgi:anti-sigma factor RsiW
MKRHERIRDAFSPLLDGEMTEEEREAIEEELAEESELLRELEGLRQVDALYRAMPEERAPADFEAGVRGKIEGKRFAQHGKRRMSPLVAPFLAAAAVVTLVAGVVYWAGQPRSDRFEMAESGAMEEPATQRMLSADAEPAEERAAADTAAPVGNEAEEDAGRQQTALMNERAALPPPPPPPTAAEPLEESAELMDDQSFVGQSVADQPPAAPPMPKADEDSAAPPAQAPAPAAEPESAPAPYMAEERASGRSAYQPATADVVVGERRFQREGELWRQSEYDGEETEALARDADSLPEILADETERGIILALPGPVIFRAGDTWYRLEAPVP